MQHTHTCTTRCLVDKHPEGLPCYICTDHADSWHERVVRGVLLGWGVAFEVYPKLLGGRHGSVDLFVIHANLIIAVDGPSHMEEACRGVSLQQQIDIDRAFDDACMARGRRLLRVHYGDIERGDAAVYVWFALRFCTLYPSPTPFIIYSKRYLALGYKPRGLPTHRESQRLPGGA